MTSVRRVASVLAAVALVAACGGDDRPPEERLAAAAEATRAAGTTAFTLETRLEMGREGAGMDMTMTGEGMADLENRLGRVEMKSLGVDAPVTTVFDGDVTYTRFPPFMSGGEERWVRQEGAGALGWSSAEGVGENPLDILGALDEVEGEITPLGADTVRGTDVQGFGFRLSGATLWGRDESVPRQLRDLEVPSEVWLDAGDRVRRMVVEIDLEPVMEAVEEQVFGGTSEEERGEVGRMLGGMEGTMTTTTVFHDFGTAVDVSPPDSADVVDRSDARPRMRRGDGASSGGDGGPGG